VHDVEQPTTESEAPIGARRGIWVAAAVAVALILSAVSIYAEVSSNRAGTLKSQEAATSASAAIASTLRLAVQREQDLVVNAAAFFVGSPAASQAQFTEWNEAADSFGRYPELDNIAEVTMVTPAQLGAFAAREAPGGSGPRTAGSTFAVTPPGIRPYYCLGTVWEVRDQTSGASSNPPGLDYCQTAAGPWLLKIRDSGQGAVLPYGSGRSATLGVGWPIYRAGSVPGTVAARRNAFIGWVAEQLDPRVDLATALVGHHQTAVVMSFGSGASAVAFSAGSAPLGARTSTIAIGNGWVVKTRSVVAAPGLLGSGTTVLRLAGGILLGVLLGLLIYLLGTGRSRARKLVRERTVQLRHQALHDSLTGLPNRALILDRIAQLTARSRREGTPMAVFFLDLDNFKDVNDTLGHGAGDQLLVAVGARVSGLLRDGDTVGRLGGDEFVVVVDGPSLVDGLDAVAERILGALASPFEIEASDTPQWVTASIGIAEGARSTAEELLQDADIALYRAKASGKRHAVVFSHSMQEEIDDRRSLETDLRGALEAGQFFVHYLPTTDLSSREVTGVEARLGWRHPERGVVPLLTFLPVLESTGMMVPVGRWMLQAACRDGAAWHRHGEQLMVSVDIYSAQFEQPGFVDDVDAALSESGFDPGHLVVTLAEASLASGAPNTIDRLRRVKALGVRVALAEFDSGYSSLTLVQRFPIDILKIDPSLVAQTADPEETDSLTGTLSNLGRVFGVDIIFESREGDAEPVPPHHDRETTGAPVATALG